MVDPHRHRTDPLGGATRARLTALHTTRRPRKNPYLRPWIRALPIDIGRASVRQQGSKHNLDPLRQAHHRGERSRLGERQEIRATDPYFAEILTNLQALSDGDLATISSDNESRRWVVSFTHDREDGVTWLYDHTTGASRKLFRPFPHLNPEAMAAMTPVTITARDGLQLPSYLTLPVGIEPSKLPMVLMVHGGPWTRDAWGFDRTVQLLANRGYAVLRVNFRGSAGFGKTHMQAAVGEFAGKMHDDLIDAVDWAVEEGFAGPDRVAIFGGSYGGYATLVGVTFTPDRFAAAVEYVGISNLANFMRTVPEHAKSNLVNNWYHYVGDPEDPTQEADMLARSPISRVDDIRTPLMVVQGANDVRVVQAESDNIVGSLRSRALMSSTSSSTTKDICSPTRRT